MPYDPENNPYVPGDPYSYDLNWMVEEVKKAQAVGEEAAGSAEAAAASAEAASDSAYNAATSASNALIFSQNAEGSAEDAAASAEEAAGLVAPVTQALNTQGQQISVLEGRMDTFASLTQGSTTGDAELQDIRVAADGTVYPTAGDAVRGQVNAIESKLSPIDASIISGNVFDSNNVVHGYKAGGSAGTVPFNQIVDANACYYIYPIPIKGKNGTLTISLVNFPFSYLGDAVGLLIRSSDQKIYTPVYGHRTLFDTITFTGSWTETNEDMLLVLNCTETNKDSYAVYVNEESKQYSSFDATALNAIISPLYSRKVRCNGDSIMVGAGYAGGFMSIIADKLNMDNQNIAVGGGTIATGTTEGSANRHWISDTMGDLTDGDYFIINGGVNDYSLNVPLFPAGETAPRTNIRTTRPTDTSIFSEAMEAICFDLITAHPTKKLGFVFPHKISWLDWTTNSLGYTYMDYKNAQKAILKKWGIPYIDISEISHMNTVFPAISSAYTSGNDRTHPNVEGYNRFYVPAIIKWMESL